MNKEQPYSLEKAKNYSFLLLKFRLRSEKEISQRLKQKDFPESIIQETLQFLKEHRFIDDAVFAKAWIASRLKKPLGLSKIREELRIKGIDNEIVAAAWLDILPDYSQEEVVTRIVQQRLAKSKGIEPLKAKRRIFAYLLRRGFSADVIIQAME